jgi:hypothetical protein
VNRTVARGLVAAGTLAPILTPDAEHALGEHRFAHADVDALLDRALAGAAEVESAPPGFGNLRRAAAAAGVSAAEVLRAVLDGHIGERRRLGGEPGLSGLLVPLGATRAVFGPDPETRDVATYRAARLLRTTTRVIAALIADREDGPILPSRPAPNNRSAAARAIPRAALEAFHRDHVGLIALSRERDLHHLALAARLRARGVAPAFDPAAVKATFYRRAVTLRRGPSFGAGGVSRN